MINPRNICISAAAGFFLSFIICLVSHVHFPQAIIRPFIFAFLFALLCVAVTYLYNTFLSNPAEDSAPGEQSSDENTSKPVTGGLVNIVVDDSTLKDDSDAPKFSVSSVNVFDKNSLARPSSQVKKTVAPPPSVSSLSPKTEVPEQKSENAFVSSDLTSITAKAESSKVNAAAVPSAPAPQSSSPEVLNLEEEQGEKTAAGEELDELPDIGSIDMSASSSSKSSDVIEDSDFATSGTKAVSQAASSVTDTSSQNIDAMAQAIKTLLAKDKQ